MLPSRGSAEPWRRSRRCCSRSVRRRQRAAGLPGARRRPGPGGPALVVAGATAHNLGRQRFGLERRVCERPGATARPASALGARSAGPSARMGRGRSGCAHPDASPGRVPCWRPCSWRAASPACPSTGWLPTVRRRPGCPSKNLRQPAPPAWATSGRPCWAWRWTWSIALKWSPARPINAASTPGGTPPASQVRHNLSRRTPASPAMDCLSPASPTMSCPTPASPARTCPLSILHPLPARAQAQPTPHRRRQPAPNQPMLPTTQPPPHRRWQAFPNRPGQPAMQQQVCRTYRSLKVLSRLAATLPT